nr:MAG TPA: hypothetical protein [Caudoviricetes sp.]
MWPKSLRAKKTRRTTSPLSAITTQSHTRLSFFYPQRGKAIT